MTIAAADAWNGHSLPTLYNGVQFRSRLEARWAVFMDHLGVQWFYEYEGFSTAEGWYVPDFWLPGMETWLEIKPMPFIKGHRDRPEWKKFEAFARLTKQKCILFCGSPGEQETYPGDSTWYENESGYLVISESQGDNHYLWCRCGCGRYGIEFDGRGHRICEGNPCGEGPDKYTGDDPSIAEAKKMAMACRFR